MAKTNWQDPKTSEMRSTHVSGLMEAVGKIEDSIGMESVYETNIPLTEVFISSDDRYRIFQAPEGKRNWTAEQVPVIKRNGSIITSGFEFDYGGGAIILNVNDTVANTYTADVTYIAKDDVSLREQINDLDADVVKLKKRIGIEYNIGSWAEVQDIVRGGKAESYFSVGDQFMATYNGVEYVWDIIGINHDTPTDTTKTFSMTIQTRDCLQNVQFDAPEPTNTDANRQRYGNNRYIHSAIKQWLNSNDAVFTWVSKHQYDAAPTGAPYTGPGFLKLLDPELVAVIGAVDKQVAVATVDGGGQDLFSDKVFLLSRKEIYGTDEGTVTGEKVYPFYSAMAGAATDAALAGRIKLLSNAARRWWLRSPYVGYSYGTRLVYTDGGVSDGDAIRARGLAPACCIV